MMTKRPEVNITGQNTAIGPYSKCILPEATGRLPSRELCKFVPSWEREGTISSTISRSVSGEKYWGISLPMNTRPDKNVSKEKQMHEGKAI